MSGIARVLTCVFVVIILYVFKSFFIDIPMGWKHGGGAIPMTIFTGICGWCVLKTWKRFEKEEKSTVRETSNTESDQDISHIPPEQAIKCPECGRDILKSSSCCHYCKAFISSNYINTRNNIPSNIDNRISTATTKVDNQEEQKAATLNPNEFIGKEILAEFKELAELSPRAAAMALEDSPDGACIRSRLAIYGADSAMDRADLILILRILNEKGSPSTSVT